MAERKFFSAEGGDKADDKPSRQVDRQSAERKTACRDPEDSAGHIIAREAAGNAARN